MKTMREIKFRAWEPIYGMHKPFSLREISEFKQPTNGGKIFERVWLDGIVFMQFTGLKDKNGRDIYEGDVVKTEKCYCGDSKYNEEIGIVQFDAPEFYIKNYKGCEHNGFVGCEVIGNIYQNPDLL